jgi:hypothetical protein
VVAVGAVHLLVQALGQLARGEALAGPHCRAS